MFLQNHRGKGDFSQQELYLFFQSKYLLTLFPAETVAMKLWKSKTRYYHQKLKLRVVSRIAEQFKTYDLRKWGNIKAIYLSFNWLNDSWTRYSWIWTRNSWIWTRNSWIWTRNLWIWTRTFEFQLVLLSFQIVTSNS